MPGEYAAIGRPLGPDRWKVTDVIATASLVGGIFGKGGGDELTQCELRRSFRGALRRAPRRAAVARRPAAYEDPEAPTTVRSRRFPYQTPPKRPARGGARDRRRGIAAAHARSWPTAAAPAPRTRASAADERPASRRAAHEGMSNALVVSGGRVGQRAPARRLRPADRVLHAADPHGAGRARARASTRAAPRSPASTSTSSSAAARTTRGARRRPARTSSTRSPSSSASPTAPPRPLPSMHYRYRGECLAIEVLERTNRWSPDAGRRHRRPARSTLRAERTKLGLVSARGDGRAASPSPSRALRSTYCHEVDSALGFADFNDPGKVHDAASFQRAAHQIGYTFNWLYADDRDIAYFNSGNNPQRAPGVRASCRCPRACTGAASTPTQHGRLHVVRRAPAGDQRPAVPDVAGTTSRRAATRAPTRTCYSSVYRSQTARRGDRQAHRRAGEDRPARARRGDGRGRDDRPARRTRAAARRCG